MIELNILCQASQHVGIGLEGVDISKGARQIDNVIADIGADIECHCVFRKLMRDDVKESTLVYTVLEYVLIDEFAGSELEPLTQVVLVDERNQFVSPLPFAAGLHHELFDRAAGGELHSGP